MKQPVVTTLSNAAPSKSDALAPFVCECILIVPIRCGRSIVGVRVRGALSDIIFLAAGDPIDRTRHGRPSGRMII